MSLRPGLSASEVLRRAGLTNYEADDFSDIGVVYKEKPISDRRERVRATEMRRMRLEQLKRKKGP